MKIKIYNPFYFLTIILLFGFNTSYAQKSESAVRTKTNIDLGWNYLENDTKNLSEVNSASNWVTLNLPHSWNSEDATDNNPGYRRSASWYKKNLVIDKIDSDKLYKLYFEGSNITTKVYVNGKEVGEHIGGYIGFSFDISKFINEGNNDCLLYTSPSPRDRQKSRMPSSA